MDVEAAAARRVEHRRRQDQPVGGDHRGIELQGGEMPPAPRIAAQPRRRAHRQAQALGRAACDRGRAAAAWPRPAGRGGWQ